MTIRKKDILRPLIQEGQEHTSRDFASQLANDVLWAYRKQAPVTKQRRYSLGKIILGILVILNLWVLWQLQPFAIQPALFAGIAGFLITLTGVMFCFKRVHRP